MKKKRIVITGMGVVSSLGHDPDTFYKNLLDGKSGITTITQFPTDNLATKFGGIIADFDPGEYIEKKQARRVDKFTSFAMVAAKKALEHAGFNLQKLDTLNKYRCGIVIGSGMGGMGVFVDGIHTMRDKGANRVSPFFIPFILTNMAGGLVAMDLGFMGPNYSISTACATANNSIIAAAEHIYRGDTDLMITGGSEAAIIPMGIAGFNACKALSQRNDAPAKASRPWDKDRDGFVMGEGAGVIILEELEHAKKRGAHIIAEYLGGGLSCDAYHMTEPSPDGEGVAHCIQNALNNAERDPSSVHYINCHATSTPAGDMAEIKALKKVFKNPAAVTINSTKSMIGHCLGAAGGLEAIATLKAIETSMVHPTINLENPEPDLAFHAPTKAENLKIQVALSNSFGFGGHNATLVFAPYSA